MEPHPDTNAVIWRSPETIRARQAALERRHSKHAAQWQLLGELLPFGPQDAFTFADLGAGTGSAAQVILGMYPRSTAILTDFSAPMMAAGEAEMARFAGRFSYVEFDMSAPDWPAAVPGTLDAVVTSMCIHHLPDRRKAGLSAEIFDHLAPGGWYLSYDAVAAPSPVADEAWQRVTDLDPEELRIRLHATPEERARRENHLQYVVGLPQQLGYLQGAGFEGVDVFWKRLDAVVYGGRRPVGRDAAPAGSD
jgi:SAM-dependent methyltransferase